VSTTNVGESTRVVADAEESTPASVGRIRLASDVVALLSIPVVLLAVFALPASTRRAAAFSYTDPTIVTAFTAHYVHLSFPHLVGNVLGFLLLGSVAYGLSVAAGRRRLFLVSGIAYLFAFPFVLSGLNLAIPRNAIGYGFSGVTMAFLGYVAVVFPVALEERFGFASRRLVPALFFVSVAYVAVIALPISTRSAGFGAAVLTFALPYGRGTDRDSVSALRCAVRRVLATPRYGELVAVATLVLVAYPLVGFPPATSPGLRVNVYIHFLGYALSFLVVYVSLLVDRHGVFSTAAQ
jgi:membrane associated rhomboid family serine protease